MLLNADNEEVHSVLMGLKTKSAPGWDNIPTRFLKLAEKEVVPIITHLSNLCFNKGVFPKLLKESIITPVYKNGDGEDVNNYRPISVLPAISKIIEKLINKRLLCYLNDFNILSESQYGFRSGKNTEDAVTALTSLIVDKLDNKAKCLAVFLDLKKAFDTVSIPILVRKMEDVGIRGIPLELLNDYLGGRAQRVKVGQTVSSRMNVTYGVPQGSVLGPTLFLIYINDLCNIKTGDARIFSYADDTAVVFSGSTWTAVKNEAENGLSVIGEWLRTNLLTLNTQKTNYICFSILDGNQPSSDFDIKIHGYDCGSDDNCCCPSITKVASTKYLGIVLDQRLTWQSHIDLVAGRIRKLTWIFKMLRHVADKKLLKLVYIALAQSIITYCLTVWGGALKTKFLMVERAQRALLKVMYFKNRRFSTQALYAVADVLTIRKLYILHTVIKRHKTLKFDPSILQKRRHYKVAIAKRTHTQFAKNQFQYLSSLLYNRSNKYLQLFSMTSRECKIKLTSWLKNLQYSETELLLKL